MKTTSLIASILGCSLAVGCASAPPPRELVDARAAYQQAAQGPAARHSPAQLHVAKTALDRAERAYDDKGGDSEEAKDLGYIAHRKALTAQATGRALEDMEQKKVATTELERLRGTMVEQATGQLDATRRQLEQEQKARMEAEAKTKEALAKLAGMQQKEDDRGLVLTLSGSVLFASGKSELLPSARTRLNEVASAIKSDDSQGSDTFNQQLSQRRADAVRQYLISQGMPADRIRAEGIGEAQPIADNGTAEGRANNRRVEIVLQKNAAARSGTSSSTGNTRPPTGGTP